MRLIIAGSRDITDEKVVEEAIEASPYVIEEIDTILCGMADGVDRISKNIFEEIDDVNIEKYPYDNYIKEAPQPKMAPLIRNEEMAKKADSLLAVWNGESKGTEHMIEKARENNLNTYIHLLNNSTISDFTD